MGIEVRVGMRFLLLFILFSLLSGCGKKGPLLYPDMLVPAAVTALTANQSGASVKIAFELPNKDMAGRSLRDLAGVSVFKRVESSLQQPDCPACTDDFRLFRKLYLDLPDATQIYGNKVVLLDGETRRNTAYSYYVVPFARDNSVGASSAPVRVRVTLQPLPPVLQVLPAPTEIKLEFVAIPPEEGSIVGYNLYRTAKNEPMPYLPLNKEPLTGTTYTDSGLERKTVYRYVARTVVRMPWGGVAESGASNEAEGALKEEE
ncbi:fibronectin type III domain-containing protein [Oryzomonas japonica]|uniref:Fibronectin type III domain-containing protein n=1 Tax=Oryzomonas japonica TaxID=2603858 RepID=A0A7J4ZVI9_9BACT|nr:fibronectin type III domain-containing protein [Oryzomonas japonica]KAB0667562.1 fibronectin type III domain-containing protein [Oryzomonas japonica]